MIQTKAIRTYNDIKRVTLDVERAANACVRQKEVLSVTYYNDTQYVYVSQEDRCDTLVFSTLEAIKEYLEILYPDCCLYSSAHLGFFYFDVLDFSGDSKEEYTFIKTELRG